MQVNYTTFFNAKSATCKSRFFWLETLVSSCPINAGCSFIGTLQTENKYDYEIFRDITEFSLLQFWDPFLRPLGVGARGKCPTPTYRYATTHEFMMTF